MFNPQQMQLQMQEWTKLFDPQQMTSTMQKYWDMQAAASASKQQLETMKKLGSTMADTFSACSEKQLKFCQSTMEECIEAMRELATAKGLEEYMQKSAQLSQKNAEKCQSMAQEMGTQWQKCQTQCTDLITKAMQQSVEATTKSWQSSTSSNSK